MLGVQSETLACRCLQSHTMHYIRKCQWLGRLALLAPPSKKHRGNPMPMKKGMEKASFGSRSGPLPLLASYPPVGGDSVYVG